jgi:SulP family sulfate permease
MLRTWFARGAPALANGGIVAIVTIAAAISCAAFIFHGPLGSGLGFGVNCALLCMVSAVVLTLRGSIPFTVGGPDPAISAVLLVGSAPLIAMAGTAAVPTMLMAIALASAVAAVLLYVLGLARASRVVRFVPYPIVGGFAAASGLYCMIAGLQLLAGASLAPAALAAALHGGHGAQLGVGIAFAVLTGFAARRWGAFALPAIIVAVIVLGLATPLAGLPYDMLQRQGWLLHVPAGGVWLPELRWGEVDWAALVPMVGSLITIAFVATLGHLVDESGLEALTRTDIDLDADLRSAGLTNALGALIGALPTYCAYSRSLLLYQLGTRDRWAGIVVAALALIVVAIGSDKIVDHVPTIVPAALLLSTGYTIIAHWLFAMRKRLPWIDLAIVWAIVAMVVAFGFVTALVAGLVLCCVTFAVRYSRVDAIERRLSAQTFHSSLQRSQREMETLGTYGASAQVYILRGYIFFGMADPLYRELLRCVESIDGPAWLVVDFAAVTGIDSSVASAFVKLLNAVDPARVRLMLSGMTGEVATHWHAMQDGDTHALLFNELDLAMEWCENDLLRAFDSYADVPESFASWIAEQVGEDLAPTLLAALERVEVDTGEALFYAGDDGGRMFFIERGRVAVIVGETTPRRVRSLGPQTIVGELGLYRYVPYEGTAVAELPTVAHVLSRDALDVIEAQTPLLASWFHASIVRTLADRLAYQTDLVVSRA